MGLILTSSILLAANSLLERYLAGRSHILIFALIPLLLSPIGGFLVARRQRRKETSQLKQELNQVQQRAARVERERNLAQENLFRRLSEERELSRQRSQFQEQLAQYEKYSALARLALGAAHEINNPLLGILSHLELQLRAVSDEEQRVEIEQCIAAVKRISSTLRGLVNYARPDPLVLSQIHLHRLTGDTLSFLEGQPLFRGKRVENLVPPMLPKIWADANQLSQVLVNLLLNAAEATSEGGRITVSAIELTYVKCVEIQVHDTGAGIPADVLPHIFEPFFTTKRGKGTGLGLSITESYVRSHEGEIRADSVPNYGTTITIKLPIGQQSRTGGESRTNEEMCSEVVD